MYEYHELPEMLHLSEFDDISDVIYITQCKKSIVLELDGLTLHLQYNFHRHFPYTVCAYLQEKECL